MAAKFFTGLPLDGPDPECVQGHGEQALAGRRRRLDAPPAQDHSKPVPISLTRKRPLTGPPGLAGASPRPTPPPPPSPA